MNRTRIILFLAIGLSVLVYFPTWRTYFSQDDWVFLSHVYKKPFSSVFRYYPESFYRPLGQQLPFYLSGAVFNLDPRGYRLVAFLVHTTNIMLLAKLFTTFGLSMQKRATLLLFYALHPVHLIALNWLTQIDIEMAAMFSLLTVLFWKRRFLPLVSFIAAILSHETAAMLPVVFLWRAKDQTVRAKSLAWLAKAMLFFLIAFSLLTTKYLMNPFPFRSDYSLVVEPFQLLSTIKWYVLRALYIPEGVRQLPLTVLILSVLSAASLAAIFHRTLLRGLLVFVLGLLPVLLLSKHLFSVYAVIPVLAMTIELGRSKNERFFLWYRSSALILILFATSLLSAKSTIPAHWSTTRGELARQLTAQYVDAGEQEKQELKKMSADNQNHPETYFASMGGRQFEVLTR